MDIIRSGSDYALRSLVYMARFPKGKVFYLNTIARKRRISHVFLHKIFQKLSSADIVTSHRGIQGGFSIARDPSRITVREVLESIQGDIVLNRCIIKKDACYRTGLCSIRENLIKLQNMLSNALDGLTLEDLAKEEKKR